MEKATAREALLTSILNYYKETDIQGLTMPFSQWSTADQMAMWHSKVWSSGVLVLLLDSVCQRGHREVGDTSGNRGFDYVRSIRKIGFRHQLPVSID
jgi:hypothetical protein